MSQLLEQVRSYADLAIHFDVQGFKEAALFYYNETALLIETHLSGSPDTVPDQVGLPFFHM